VTAIVLWLVSRLVPAPDRARWLEEWRAELPYARRSMLAGALPDALAVRRLSSPRRRQWRGPWLTDARHTVRSLARSPWHVLTVTWCLGMGIAVTVTVFSIVASVLAGELPGVRDRASLRWLYVATEDERGRRSSQSASIEDFEVMREGTASMPSVAAEGSWQFAVRTSAGTSVMAGAVVSGNYFDVLGTRPVLGRLLTPDDDRLDAPLAIVISHAFWGSHFGSREDVIGMTLSVTGREGAIVGVAPEHFSGMDVGDPGEPPGHRFRLFVPLAHAPLLAPLVDPDGTWLRVYGRIQSDRTNDALAAEFEPIARRMENTNPTRRNAAIFVQAAGLAADDNLGIIAIVVTLVMAAPLTVLAIACANVANLQLVRASLRTRELTVRSSLGASRAQLVRLLTTEAAALALIGTAAGMLGTYVLLRVAALVIPFHSVVDWPVMAFVVALVGSLVIATGVIPAWIATRPGEASTLGGSQRSAGLGVSRLRRSLVMAQVALSLLLLLVAAVFARCLQTLAGQAPRFAHESVVADIRFDMLGYSEPQRDRFAAMLQARLLADGRVRGVGFNSVAPFRYMGHRFWLPRDAEGVIRDVRTAEVSPDWFGAAAVPIVHGRTFHAGDERLADAVIVNQAFVDRYRLEEPVLGTVIRVDAAPNVRLGVRSANRDPVSRIESLTIVGIAGNEASRPLTSPAVPRLYFPLQHVPDYVALYVRTEHAAEISRQIRGTMASIDADLPAVNIATLADRYRDASGDIRLLALAASGIGMCALALAIAGVYAVVAFFVSLRTKEFGIRMAIGAAPADIVAMVLAQASRLVGGGLIVGLLLGTPLVIALVRAFPYTSFFDPVAMLVPAAALIVSAVAAAMLPAGRAARVDPCAALRSE
jgi:putative ABC transport system permease protein